MTRYADELRGSETERCIVIGLLNGEVMGEPTTPDNSSAARPQQFIKRLVKDHRLGWRDRQMVRLVALYVLVCPDRGLDLLIDIGFETADRAQRLLRDRWRTVRSLYG